MKWKDDPLKMEKNLLFDGIIKFCHKFLFEESRNVSIRDLADFVDEFIKDRL